MNEKSINNHPLQPRYLFAIGFLSWVAMISIDFFLHSGLLAKFYIEPSPFLLSPDEAFRLIPFRYLSFVVLEVLLIWLMVRLNIIGWLKGLVFGLSLGGLIWGSFILGLLSISTADRTLLVAWFLGQTFELGIGGAVLGEGLKGNRQHNLFLFVMLGIILVMALTGILQTIGFAPSIQIKDPF